MFLKYYVGDIEIFYNLPPIPVVSLPPTLQVAAHSLPNSIFSKNYSIQLLFLQEK